MLGRARSAVTPMSSTKARALTPIAEGMKALPSKLYFRIGEVAGMVGVEPHVLRYWEREFRAIRPTKSSKGQRVYSRARSSLTPPRASRKSRASPRRPRSCRNSTRHTRSACLQSPWR